MHFIATVYAQLVTQLQPTYGHISIKAMSKVLLGWKKNKQYD